MMNWNTVMDLAIEFGYNAATSLMSYVVGTNVLAMPKPAAYLVAALVGFVGMANHWRALRKVTPVLVLALVASGCALTTGYAGKHPGFQDITCKGKVAITGSGTVALGAGYGGATTDSFSLNGDCGDGFSITRSQGKAVPVAVPVEPAPTTTK